MANPEQGQLRCYVCGHDEFIWHPNTNIRVFVMGEIPIIQLPEDAMATYSLLCGKCGVLQYVHDRGWYIGNVSLVWDEEQQKLVEHRDRLITAKKRLESSDFSSLMLMLKANPEAMKRVKDALELDEPDKEKEHESE